MVEIILIQNPPTYPWTPSFIRSVRKQEVQRSKMKDYIQKNVLEQSYVFFVPQCLIVFRLLLESLRKETALHFDVSGRVARLFQLSPNVV